MASKKYKIVERTRRKNGEGSIYQQKSGLWTGKIWIDTPNGTKERKTVYGESQADVAKKLVALSGSMNPLNSKMFTQKTFGQLFEDWLLVFKKSAVAPRTFEGNVRNWRIHIKPFVHNMKLTDVSAQAVQQVINEVLIKGKSVNLARKIKFLFNQFFEYAIECGYIENNPVNRIKIRARDISYNDKDNLYKAIPQEERMSFLNALSKTTLLKPLCMTMMFAGLRTGETLALRWGNVDFENHIIKVRNGITQVPTFDSYGNVIDRKTVIGDAKTACSVRDVPIPSILIEVLKDWKKCQWVKQQMTGKDLLSSKSVVFSNDDGSVRTYSGTRMIFNRFAKKHGFFGKVHFHTLRHTYSTMLFEMNENPKIIQALLGHKSVKTTLTIYNSVDKSYFKEATEKLNNLFSEEKMAEFNELHNKPDIPALKKPIEEVEELNDDDPEIAFLEKMLAEKRARKKLNEDEM